MDAEPLHEADHPFKIEHPGLVAVQEQLLHAARDGYEVTQADGLADRVDGPDERSLAAEPVVGLRQEAVEAERDLVQTRERRLFEQRRDALSIRVNPHVLVAERTSAFD